MPIYRCVKRKEWQMSLMRKRRSTGMTVLVLTTMVMLLVFGVAAKSYAETGKRGSRQEVERGKKIYTAHCKSCHGKNGIGQPPIPWSIRRPDYFTPPALDDSQHAWHHSDADLMKMILEGSPRTTQMPAWQNVLTAQDARDVIAYMKSLWSDRALACQGPKHMSCM